MNYIYNAYHHFLTITKHKCEVMKNCFAVGLYRQGLLHDLSKYSWEEFATGVKYYQGNRSPNAAEKEEKGYSAAWLHHKGRNKHHFEYWTDLSLKTRAYAPVEMPARYLAEMVMDRIAACKTYQGAAYTDGAPLEYFEKSGEWRNVHPKTRAQLICLLTMLRDRGEKETFRYIREVIRNRGVFRE